MMFRRPLPLLALVSGLAALIVGVAGLQRVFVRERNDARQALVDRQAALQGFAVKALHERCRRLLEGERSRMQAALRDPLVDASGLLRVEAGRQQLPRTFEFREGGKAPAHELYDALRAGRVDLSDLDEDDPWRDRLLLFRQFSRAVRNGDRAGIAASFRGILTHRARFVISSRKDLAYQAALLDLFQAQSSPDPVLMEKILRDGLTDSRGHRMLGLQGQLLSRREKLTQPDFEFLAERIAKLSESAGVKRDDFLARVEEPSGKKVRLPENIGGPLLLDGGMWFVEQTATGALEGLQIDLDRLVGQVASDMQDRQLIDTEAEILVPDLSEHPQPLLALSLTIKSPEWTQASQAIQRRYWLKTGLALTLGLLTATIILLGAALYRREQQLLSLKSEFVATVSHELRTPLASMRLMAETLERRLEGTESARDYPSRIIHEIDSLSFLVENILSFNRLDKGRWKPHVSDIQLGDLVADLKEHLQGATQAEVQVQVGQGADVGFHADPELMKLLFLNLGSNACKYNERNPVKIQIDADVDDRVVIRVTDNGVGIPVEEKDRVFTEFYRARRAESKRGFGLGLAICRKIMELHAGDIRVSRTSADGTTFELSFPGSVQA